MAKSWFENAHFWQEYAPVLFDEHRWAEARGVAEAVVNLASLRKGSSVLDACCGPGRISTELALLGMNVTGTDIMDFYLEAAKESAIAENVNVELIHADMRTFCRPNKFDLAVNLYTSIGYCESPEEDAKIIQNMIGSVKPGGFVIIETASRESAILNFTPGEEYKRVGLLVKTEFSVFGAWEGLCSKWTLTAPDGKITEHEFVQRLYSATELRAICANCGLKNIAIYGGFDGRAYDQNARTLVLVGKKPQ